MSRAEVLIPVVVVAVAVRVVVRVVIVAVVWVVEEEESACRCGHCYDRADCRSPPPAKGLPCSASSRDTGAFSGKGKKQVMRGNFGRKKTK